MYRSIIVIMVWMLFGVLTLKAQDCNLSVRLQVTELHNAQPVYPAVVYVDELQKDYETDEKGRVNFTGICKGTYTFHLHSMGFEHLSEQISITGDTQIRLKAAHVANVLGAVQVTDERVQTLLQSKDKLGKRELVANSGKNLGELLQSINGVTMLSNGGNIAKPVIHGLYGSRIVMLNNGVRQEDQQWGNEHAPNIDPFLANNITVIKGASSVRYGTDAIAGVVMVEPASIRSMPGWGGEVNLAGFGNNRMGVASGMLEYAFKKMPTLGIRLQGTYKQGGNYRIPGYWAANTGVKEQNFSATVSKKGVHSGFELFYSRFENDLGVYRGAHTGNDKDKAAAVNSPVPLVPADFTYDIERPMQHVVHDLAKARGYLDSRIGMWSMVYAYQKNFRQEYDILRKDNGKAQLNLNLVTQTLNVNLDHKPFAGFKGQVGIDGMYRENYFNPGDRIFIPNYSSPGIAAYIIERYSYRDWLFEAGLRHDYLSYDVYNPEGASQQIVHHVLTYGNTSGTVGVSRKMNARWDVSATLANAWRAPQASELFSAGLHQGAARLELGDKNLRPERSYNLNLESKHNWRKLSASVGLYSQYIKDFIYLQPGPDVLTIRGFFKSFNYTQTDAWLNGADVSVQYRWTKALETGVKASVLRARNVTRNDWLILMPADRFSLNARYNFNDWGKLRECYISAEAKQVLEQTRIPANFDSVDFPRPPATYFLLDAEAGGAVYVKKQPVYISVGATNILNRKYRDYLDVFRYFLDRPGRNIVLRMRVPFTF